MYRIELAPGEETVYRTIDELATAVRRGLVTGRSRIYHNATQKWLPIEFHPHYKKILENPNAKTLEMPGTGEAPDIAPVFKSVALVAAREPKPESAPAPRPAPSPEPAHAPSPASEPLTATIPVTVASPVLSLPKIDYRPPAPIFAAATSPVSAGPATTTLPPWRRADDPLATPEWPSALESVVDAAVVEPAEREAYVIEPAAESAATGRRRPIQLVAAAAGVALVGYGLFAAFGTSRGSATHETQAERPVMPAAEAPAATPAARPRAPEVPTSVTAGFAAGLPDRTMPTASSGSPAAVGPETTTIAPPPAELDLALPTLQGSDSLVRLPDARRDSAAIKRILRAVSGKDGTGR